MGVPYFECPVGTGVFAQPGQLSASGGVPASPQAAATPAAAVSAIPSAALDDDEIVIVPAAVPSQFNSSDGAFSLGQPVMWNGKKSIVRYIGDVEFAKGEWVGLELTDTWGVHDGSVLGVPYFECPAGKGVFAQLAQLSASAPAAPTIAPTAPRAVAAPDEGPAVAAPDEGPATLPSKEKTADGSISLGQQVIWMGKKSIVRYIGDVRFAAGEWVGLELTDAKGVHNGNVMGVPYFECPTAMGVFAQPAQLSASGAVSSSAQAAAAPVATIAASPKTVAAPRPEDEDIETLPSREMTADGGAYLGQEVMWKGKQGVVRYIGDVRFAAGEWVGVEMLEAEGMHDGNVLGVPYFKCASRKGIFSRSAELQTAGTGASASVQRHLRQVEAAATVGAIARVAGTMRLGQRVMWRGAHAGTVRYIGTVKFAPGEFAGVELDDAVGYYDGSFMGDGYFKCESGKGVFSNPAMLKVMAEA